MHCLEGCVAEVAPLVWAAPILIEVIELSPSSWKDLLDLIGAQDRADPLQKDVAGRFEKNMEKG